MESTTEDLSSRIEEAGIEGPAAEMLRNVEKRQGRYLGKPCEISIIEALREASRLITPFVEMEGEHAEDALVILTGLCAVLAPGQPAFKKAIRESRLRETLMFIPSQEQILAAVSRFVKSLQPSHNSWRAALSVCCCETNTEFGLKVILPDGSKTTLRVSALKTKRFESEALLPEAVRMLVADVLKMHVSLQTFLDFASLKRSGFDILHGAETWGKLFNGIVENILGEGEMVRLASDIMPTTGLEEALVVGRK